MKDAHERASSLDQAATFSYREENLLRKQEKRWCTDLKELVRRLVSDGFQYELQFEREVPQESVPIVVVEDASNWEQDAERARLERADVRRMS